MLRIMICDSDDQKITAIRTMLDKQARKFPGGLTINIRRDLQQLLYDIEEGQAG